MQLQKLAILLTASFLFFGCSTSQPKQIQSSPTPSETPPPVSIGTLKEAIKELKVLQAKVEGGIDDRGYAVIITKTSPLVQKATGEATAVAAVKSAFQGHQLALKFWQCDRLEGYDKLQQCQGKALAQIFAKYPDIKAQGEGAGISGSLAKEEILQAVWKKTSADTEVASKAVSLNSTPKAPES